MDCYVFPYLKVNCENLVSSKVNQAFFNDTTRIKNFSQRQDPCLKPLIYKSKNLLLSQ